MRHHAVGLLVALTLVLGLLTPRAAHAQRPAQVPRIGPTGGKLRYPAISSNAFPYWTLDADVRP
jgi:hypothetical protein